MERLAGAEALRQLPFRDVALPVEEAMDILTSRTMVCVGDNIGKKYEKYNLRFPQEQALPEDIESAKTKAKALIAPGGLAFSAQNLTFIYAQWGTLSYSSVVEKMVKEVIPRFFVQKPVRNPGTICVGYFLDLVSIVDPQVAGFDDAVEIIVESVRKSPDSLSWFVLGGAVDDSIKNLGAPGTGGDYLTDTETTERFRDVLLKKLTLEEKIHFMAGYEITLDEAQTRATGFSTN